MRGKDLEGREPGAGSGGWPGNLRVSECMGLYGL